MSDEAEIRNIGLLGFIAYRAMETHVMQALVAAGFDDITAAQARVFQRVGPHGTRLTQLAEQARVTKQTAAFLVDGLERAGYVERVPDPTDARARLVRIAARGRKVVKRARVAERELEAQWEEHLGARDAEELRRILGRLSEVADPYAPKS